jgi:hypothetical protein
VTPLLTQLPPDFQFSQSSLNDFVDCARRFQLRYGERLDWPAPLAEPIQALEEDARLGAAFHLMLERYYLNLAIPTPRFPKLRQWWEAFRHTEQLLDLPNVLHKPEAVYSIPFAGTRLQARFDLVSIVPGKQIVLVDWKTGKPPKNGAEALWARMQTRVYFTVARKALAAEFGGAIPPEAISFVYWFAGDPDHPIRLTPPDEQTYQTFADQITAAIGSVQRLAQTEVWPLTDDLRKCRLCNYRSFCAREVSPAPADGLEEMLDLLPALLDELNL